MGTGSNNGLTPLTPFRPQDFFAVAGPGKTLCLMDGVYRGAAYMLDMGGVAPGKSGTASAPITIRALNDGAVRIDGQYTRYPFWMDRNNWWVIQGIDVCCSGNGGAISIGESTGLLFQRVVAWDAQNSASVNTHVWSMAGVSRSTFEDVAAFGTGRHTFHCIFCADITTRRLWARHEGHDVAFSDPRRTVMTTYHLRGDVIEENVLATWSAELSTAGTPYSTLYPLTGEDVDTSVSKFLGSIGYVKCSAVTSPPEIITNQDGVGRGSSILIQDYIAVIEQGCWTTKRLLRLRDDGGGGPPATMTANRVSGWGGDGMGLIEPNWDETATCFTTNSVRSGVCPNPFTAPLTGVGAGANVCKRYKDGMLTDEPLWPWPMDQRIKAAIAQAGRAALAGPDGTVTSEIESLLGTIPRGCRSD